MKTITINQITACCLLLFITTLSFAQKATLQGRITEQGTEEGLISATIQIGSKGTATDFDGNYEIQIEAGTYTVRFSYAGYKPLEQEIVLQTGETKVLNGSLELEVNILKTATVTGSKFEKPLGEVTSSIAVLKPKLIRNVSANSIDEAITRISGVTVIDGQANIRGGSGYSYGAGSRVLLLIDDLPALTGDAGFPQWNDVPIENIEQVEIVKGASSALYGSSALNGIINIRTAYPKDKPKTSVAIANKVTLKPRQTEKAWWGNKMPLGGVASLSHLQKFGKFDLVLGANATTEDSHLRSHYSRYFRVNVGTRYRLTDALAIGVNTNYNRSVGASAFFWNDNASYEGDTTALTISNSERYMIDPFLTYFDNYGNRHKITTRYYNVDNKSETSQGNASQMYYGEYQFQKPFENINLNLTSGMVGSFTAVAAELYGDTTYTTSNAAIYAQADKKFFDKLNVSVGGRYERYTINSPAVINGDTFPTSTREAKPVFRLGLNYQAAEYTYIRASWGQGYRFPTIAEKYVSTTISPTLNIFPNPNLESESGWNAELGIRQGIAISKWKGFVELAGFWSEYNNMMEFTFGRHGKGLGLESIGFASLNIGNTRIQGVELLMNGTGALFGLPTTVNAGYTYIEPIFQDFDSTAMVNSSDTTNILKYRFKHDVKIDIETTYKKFSLGVSANYNSYMQAVDAIFEDPLFGVTGLKEYREENTGKGNWIMDMRFAYQANENARIAIICKNIFNREYTIRPALLESPINFTFRVDYTF